MQPTLFVLMVLLGCLSNYSAPTSSQTTNNGLRPIYGNEPASPQFVADRASLHSVALAGDLPTLLKAAKTLEDRWQPTARDAVCDRALTDSDKMPLAMQAYFVEHLDYVPGHAGSTDHAEMPWNELRTQRAILWLSTLQLINDRFEQTPSSPPVEPPLPARKYLDTPTAAKQLK